MFASGSTCGLNIVIKKKTILRSCTEMKVDCSHDGRAAGICLVPGWKSSLLAFSPATQLRSRLQSCQVTHKQTLSKQIEPGKPAFNLSCDNWTCYHLQYKSTFLSRSLVSISKHCRLIKSASITESCAFSSLSYIEIKRRVKNGPPAGYL